MTVRQLLEIGSPRCLISAILLALLFCQGLHASRPAHVAQHISKTSAAASTRDPKPTHSGYLPISADGSALFYAYWEAQGCPMDDAAEHPVVLWLQGGPGCASTFGGFYELGPFMVTEDLQLTPNTGSWARCHGLLLLDQPLGTGYSQPAAASSIPRDELGMAAHLYAALQAFYTRHQADLGSRPLIITGESYGGKYVPSIAHYILQAQDMQRPGAAGVSSGNKRGGSSSSSSSSSRLPTGSGTSALLQHSGGQLRVWRRLEEDVQAPVFTLAGIAIGNGLTDPLTQVPVMAESAYYQGLVTPATKREIDRRAAHVVHLIDKGSWAQAHVDREALRAFITNVTGIATMFDTRREEGYDPRASVDRFLNLPEVKAAMGAHAEVNYTSCSTVVGDIMAADTMQSVKHLLPDVLDRLSVLLYQGQFDILDGVASSAAWIDSLEWSLQQKLGEDAGTLWSHAGKVAGWRRQAGNLVHAVVYRAGHMVPHDQPGAAQELIETWIRSALEPKTS